MRYFTYMAEQSFSTSPAGERLFHLGGPFSRPYIIPDAATENKLYWKQVWLLRCFLGGLILGQPFILPLFSHSWYFLVYLFGVTFVFWFVSRILFARDLKDLQRLPARLPLRSFYAATAQRDSWAMLGLGFLLCLIFVFIGVVLLLSGVDRTVGIVSTAFFGMCAIAWGYCLKLKITTKSQEAPENNR